MNSIIRSKYFDPRQTKNVYGLETPKRLNISKHLDNLNFDWKQYFPYLVEVGGGREMTFILKYKITVCKD